jgi:gliding motility-associated-like protein
MTPNPSLKVFTFIFFALFSITFLSNGQANFEADDGKTSGCAPFQVTFKDKSVGATSWSWTFGKPSNNTSLQQSPVVTFDQAGIYTVELTINGGGSSKKLTNYITVYDKPITDFNLTYTESCPNVPVTFNNLTTDPALPIASYLWVFGDGNVSSEASPVHNYTSPGKFNVTLLAKNSQGCENTATKVQAVIVHDTKSVFSAQTFFCTAPAEVQFTNTSVAPGAISYAWDFGGEATSTEKNPKYTFIKTGSFKVKLAVKGDYGCEIVSEKIINVGTGGFTITADKSQTCINTDIQFSILNTESFKSVKWNFGNGKTSTELSPTSSYAQPGKYTVTLTAELDQCTVEQTKEIEIVNSANAQFTVKEECDRTFAFTNTTQNYVSLLWNFGDNTFSTEVNPKHIYNTSGKSTVTLTVYNQLQCPSIIKKVVTINDNPIAVIFPAEQNSCLSTPSLSGCAPFNLQFTNSSIAQPSFTSSWNFGDGQTSTTRNPKHEFKIAGTYTVTLTVKNPIGCTSATFVTVKVSSTTPIAKFDIDRKVGCTNTDTITFTSTSINATSYCWVLQPGDTIPGESVIRKVYQQPGVYSISLIAKNDGCKNIKVRKDTLTINGPYINFDFEKNCDHPYDLTFENSSTPGATFAWNFDDPASTNPVSADKDAVHKFTAQRSYDVKLKAEKDGCPAFTVEKEVVIQELVAKFLAAPDTVCKNAPVAFVDGSSYAKDWLWDFGDGTFYSGRVPFPMKTYTTAQSYFTSLTVKDSAGCVKTISNADPIVVANIDGKISFTAESICTALKVTFKDESVASPEINSRVWDFGDGGNFDAPSIEARHDYTNLGKYNVSLKVSNSIAECVVVLPDSLSFTVPNVNFSTTRENACIDELIQITSFITDAVDVNWDFGNNLLSNVPFPSVTYNDVGSYDVTARAKDIYGCEKEFKKDNFITITKPVANFEASNTITDCPPLITPFKNTSTNAEQWFWDFGDGQQSQIENPVNSYTFPGRYQVSLSVADKNGCMDTLGLKDFIFVDGPIGKFNRLNVLNCTKDSIQFSAEYANTVNASWDFGDGNIEDNLGLIVPHVYSATGKFQPIIQLTDAKNCKVLYKLDEMIVHNSPEVDFTYKPAYPFTGENVTFTASTKDPSTLLWVFADESFAQTTEAVKAFMEPDTAKVVLQLTDPATGCIAKALKEVPVQGDIDFIPNIFTPNSDQLNGLFHVIGIEKSSWKLIIYNRWGRSVYESGRYQNQWNGDGVATGVYYYSLQNNFRRDKSYKGNVHVMR